MDSPTNLDKLIDDYRSPFEPFSVQTMSSKAAMIFSL
jgi:hypothetical protein